MTVHHCHDWQQRCELIEGTYQETLARVVEVGGADLIAFSPPYCDARTYGMGVSWTDADYAELGDHVFAALKPGGHALVNVDAPVRDWAKDGRGTERGLHPWRMMIDWHDRIGFRVPDRLCFGRMGQVGRPNGRFRNDWEPLLWFQRPGLPGHHDPDSIATEATYGVVRSQRRETADVHTEHRGESGAPIVREIAVKLPGTLWDYGPCGAGLTGAPTIEAQNHPARWPYKLARDIVLCFSAPDALVVDPFVGAGTTAAAALDHGRRFIGGDLGSRQDHEDNRRRGLDAVPWVEVTRRVLAERYRQRGLFEAAP